MRLPLANSVRIGLFVICPAALFAATVSLQTTPNGSSSGQLVTITATVTGEVSAAPEGVVTFYDGREILGVSRLNGGTTALSTGVLTPGNHSLHALYRDAGGQLLASGLARYAVTALASPAFTIGNPIGSAHAAAIATGDFDGSGRPALAAANSAENTVTVILPGGASATYAVGSRPVALAAGDFNGDGHTDLAVANSGDSSISLLLGTGDGSFTAGTAIQLSSAPSSVAIADFNGDGRADIAVSLPGANSVAIFIGKGDATFLGEARFAAGTGPSSLVIGDFNGDGLADIAVANPLSNTISVLSGLAPGGFSVAVTYPAGSSPSFLAAADLNGDGLTDLAAASTDSRDITILLGGISSLSSAGSYPAGGTPSAIAIGELNGDGRAGVIWLTSDASMGSLNADGSGGFALGSPGVKLSGAALALADFNSDGRLDIALANGGVRILLGTAAPSPSPAADATLSRSQQQITTVVRPLTTAVNGQTVTVTTSNDDNSAGSLRGILATATAGTTINFSPAIAGSTITLGYCPSGAIQQCGLIVPAGVTIDGQTNQITIDGAGKYRIFQISGNTTINNLTLQNGRAAGGNGGNGEAGGGGGAGMGGAVFAQGTGNTFTSVIFQNNSAVGGAGGSTTSMNQSGGGGGGLGGDGGQPYYPGGVAQLYESVIGGGGGSGGPLSGSGGSGGYQTTLDLDDIVGELLSLLDLPELEGVAYYGRTAFEEFIGSYDWNQDSVTPPAEGGPGAGGGAGGYNVEFGAPGGFGGGGGGASTVGPYFNGQMPNPFVAIGGGSEFGGGPGGGDPTDGVGIGGNGYGGAVFIYSGATVSFSNCQFTNNSAGAGNNGLIELTSDGPYAASYGNLNGTSYGGAVYIYDGSDPYLPTPGQVFTDPAHATTFTNNLAANGVTSYGQPWQLTGLSAPNTFYVFSTATSGPGSLGEALQWISPNYTILFTPEMLNSVLTLTNGPLVFPFGLNINGQNLNITINAQNKGGIFAITNGKSVIQNITLENATVTGYNGGAGYMGGGGSAAFGGAIEILGGDVVLSHVTFTGNTVTGGSGGGGGWQSWDQECDSESFMVCLAGEGAGGAGLGGVGQTGPVNRNFPGRGGVDDPGLAGGPGGPLGGASGLGGDAFLANGTISITAENGQAGGKGAGGGGGAGGDTTLPETATNFCADNSGWGYTTCFLKQGGNGGAGGFGGGGGGSGYEFCRETSVVYAQCPMSGYAPNYYNYYGQNAQGGAGGFGGGGGGGYVPGPAGLFGGIGGNASQYDDFGGGGVASGGGGAGLGGAVFFYDGSLTIDTCTFTNNHASGGGSILLNNNVPSASVGANGLGKGGAVFRYGGTLTWQGTSTFTGNNATNAGTSTTDNNDVYGDSKNDEPHAPQAAGAPVLTSILPTTQAITSAVTGDFNNDTFPDILVGTGSGFLLYPGTGNGTFGNPIAIGAASDLTPGTAQQFFAEQEPLSLINLALDNVFGAGLSFLGTTANGLQTCLGHGNGSFECNDLGPGLYGNYVAVADFNQDGFGDVVIGSSDFSPQIQIALTNPLTGALGAFSPVESSGVFYDYGMAAGDLNGDGIPDLATYDGTSVRAFLGNGDGTFRQVNSYFATGGAPAGLPYGIYPVTALSMVLADFTGDGIPDLAVTDNVYGGSFSLLKGAGDGTFTDIGDLNPVNNSGPNWYSLAAADVNGDGQPDVVLADQPGNTVTMFLQPFTPQNELAYTINSPRSVASGDFNNDGIPDFVVLSQTPGAPTGALNILMGKPLISVAIAPITAPVYQGESQVSTATVTNATAATVNGVFRLITTGGPLLGISGNGWSCGGSTCTLNTSVTAGGTLAPLNLGVAQAGASGTATFSLTLSGAAKDTAALPVTVLPFPVTLTAIPQSTTFYSNQPDATIVITAGNSSPVALPGPFTVTNAAPAGFAIQSLGGPGWACTISTQICTRSDPMPALSGYPPITLIMKAPATAAATVTDTAKLAAPLVSVTASSSIGFTAAPYLTFSITPSVNALNQGQENVTFTLNVKNTGSFGTEGPISLQNNPGSGIVPVSLSGDGWSCTSSGVCTSNESISPGFSLPAVQFTANISGTAPASVTESATLTYSSTGGPATSFQSASSATLPVAQTSLLMRVSHSGTFSPNSTADWDIVVQNGGTSPSLATVTVTDTMPPGVTAVNIGGQGWTCSLSPLSCTRGDTLAPGYSWPAIDLTVSIGSNPLLSLTDIATLTGAGTTFSASDTAVIGAASTVNLAAPSPATQTVGQPVTFSITVSAARQGAFTPTGSVLLLDNEQALGGGVLSSQTATFTTTLLAPGKHKIQAIYAGDANFGSQASNLQQVVINALPASGQFVETSTVPGDSEATGSIVMDFNGDGIPDLVSPYNGDTNYGVNFFVGNGDGTFTFWQYVDLGSGVGVAASGDFNGDGLPDVAITGQGGNVFVLLNTASHKFASPGGGTPNSWLVNQGGVFGDAGTIATGDFNRDGKVDLIYINCCATAILYGNGDGTIASEQDLPYNLLLTGGSPGLDASIVIGDFNGDNLPDFAVPDGIDNVVNVMLGQPNGSFSTPITTATGNAPWSISPGDFNGDGRTDLAVANNQDGTVCVMLSNGDGTFSPPSDGGCYPAGAAAAVTAGDFNGDGKLDVAFTMEGQNNQYDNGTVGLLFGNGDGTMTLAPQVLNVESGPVRIFTADFNHDGLLDLAVLNRYLNPDMDIFLGSAPQWGIQITRAGTAMQNQTGLQYTVTVSNTGTGPSAGPVTVTEALGTGLTMTGMTGSGWTCAPAGFTCWRTDALSAGASYPPITVTTNVGAVPLITNTVSVAGGGALNSPSAVDFTNTSASLVTLTINQSYQGPPIPVNFVPLSVTVNGTTYALPAQVSVQADTPVIVSFLGPQAESGPGTQAIFSYWSDYGAASHSITPSSNTTLTLNYAVQFEVVTSVYPVSGGTVSGGGWFLPGTYALLTATSADGYAFGSWAGSFSGTVNPANFVVTGYTSVGANFVQSAPALNLIVASKADGATGQRVWTLAIANKGSGVATGVQIEAATVTVQIPAGGGVPVSIATHLPFSAGTIAAGQTVDVPITLNYPSTPLAVVQLQVTLTANGGNYTTTITLSNQFR